MTGSPTTTTDRQSYYHYRDGQSHYRYRDRQAYYHYLDGQAYYRYPFIHLSLQSTG